MSVVEVSTAGGLVRPVLVRRWQTHSARVVELWRTGCIVTQPPGTSAVRNCKLALVNPANQGLTGTQSPEYIETLYSVNLLRH